MLIDNKNNKLLRNRERKIERRNKIDDKLRTILNKIKTEKKRKKENIDKIKELEIELVKINMLIILIKKM